jgi:SAM-dependent methyltransferase
MNGELLKTLKTYQDEGYVKHYLTKQKALDKFVAPLFDRFMELIPGKNIIDLGCGPGYDAMKLMKRGCHVVGIDLSREMINTARNFNKNNPKGHFIVMDIMKLNRHFANEHFDGAWVCASLLHIPKKIIGKALNNVNNLLKPVGIAMVSLQNGKGEELKKEKMPEAESERFFAYWQKQEFINMAKKCGFSNIDFIQIDKWLNFYLEKPIKP